MTDAETEIRFEAPVADVQILDAYWMAEGSSRKEVLCSILGLWAQKQRHFASLVTKLTGGNPTAAADDRQGKGKA